MNSITKVLLRIMMIIMVVIVLAVILVIGWLFPGPNRLVTQALKGDISGVRLWVRFVDPNAPELWGFSHENKGRTPLTAAAERGHLDVVKVLLEHGATINTQDGFGKTALIAAVRSGSLDLVKYLIDKDADPNIRSTEGTSALHIAAACGHLPIISILLDMGMPINLTDKYGMTPLFMACGAGNVETVRYLLSRNADASIGRHGDTPIDAVRSKLAASRREHDEYAVENHWDESEYRKRIERYQQILELLSSPPQSK